MLFVRFGGAFNEIVIKIIEISLLCCFLAQKCALLHTYEPSRVREGKKLEVVRKGLKLSALLICDFSDIV
jgi:hypothetical protein